MLQQQITYCTGCGAPIRIDANTVSVTCENCETPFVYRPEINYNAFLMITGENKKKYEIPIKGNLIVGRNNRNIITITDELNPSIIQRLPVRNAHISSKHINIKANNELVIVSEGQKEYILNKKVCTIMDLDSKNGTNLNNMPLSNRNEVILQNDSEISLAPNTNKPLKIMYIERKG